MPLSTRTRPTESANYRFSAVLTWKRIKCNRVALLDSPDFIGLNCPNSQTSHFAGLWGFYYCFIDVSFTLLAFGKKSSVRLITSRLCVIESYLFLVGFPGGLKTPAPPTVLEYITSFYSLKGALSWVTEYRTCSSKNRKSVCGSFCWTIDSQCWPRPPNYFLIKAYFSCFSFFSLKSINI